MEQNKHLVELIREGEHLHQDFKFEINDSRKISRSLSAFANTSGGRLLIGVKDNGTIIGIRTDEEFYMVESAAQIYSRPEIPFQTKIWKQEGKTVLEITVPESKNKPHFVRNADGTEEAFIRIKDENILAPDVLIRVWQKQNHPKGTLVRYSQDEEILLRFLDRHDSITQTQFERLAKISKRAAAETLANLIVFDLLDYEYTNLQFRFRASPIS